MKETLADPLVFTKSEIPNIKAVVEKQFKSLEEDQLNWQPNSKKWSVGQCLDHLLKANQSYCEAIRRKLDGSQQVELQPTFKNSFTGRHFIRLMDPASSLKIPAPPTIRPQRSQVATNIVDRFLAQQDELLQLAETASQYDLMKTTVASPFLGLLRFRLGEVFDVMIKHEQRHIEQAKKVMITNGFPVNQT